MEMLLLATPPQHAASNPAVELNPRRLRQWLDDLPVMNVMQTVDLLEQKLTPFNEIRLDAAERLKLLEIFTQAFDEILFSYDEIRLSMLPVSIEERRKLSQDIMWLYLHLATGYKVILKQHFEGGKREVRDPVLLTALFRAMEMIIHALLYAFRSHDTPPPLCFLEVHQIYHYACRQGCADNRLKNLKGYAVTPTVSRLYKQFLLLMIADPYRMEGQTVFENYLLLDEYAEHAILHDLEPGATQLPAGSYFVPLMEDSHPLPARFVTEEMLQAAGLNLQLQDVLSRLRTGHNQLLKSTKSSSQAIRQHELILAQLSNPHSRREARHKSTRKVKMLLGMEAIQYYLQNPDGLASVYETEECAGIEVSSVESESATEFAPVSWQIVNESPRGMLLSTPRNLCGPEQLLGEVVGLIEKNDADKQPRILTALVRWERCDEQEAVNIGVEIIHATPQLVTAQFTEHAEPLALLYYPPNPEAGSSDYLLTPAGVVNEDRTARLRRGNRQITVSIQEPRLATAVYELCGCQLS